MAEVSPTQVAAGVVGSRVQNVKAGSQAGAYAALLFGGVLLVAAAKGGSIREILSGARSPIRPLTSPIPTSFAHAAPTSTSGGSTGGSGGGPGSVAVSPGASGAVALAKHWIGTNEGSTRESQWAAAVGISPTTAWCSAFVAGVLKGAGVTGLPADAAYSGAWLNWKGGTNLHTTSLAKARPGDLLIFDWGDGGITDHVGIYSGHGRYVAGNNSDNSVGEAPVPSGNIVGIVRPHYPGTGKGIL